MEQDIYVEQLKNLGLKAWKDYEDMFYLDRYFANIQSPKLLLEKMQEYKCKFRYSIKHVAGNGLEIVHTSGFRVRNKDGNLSDVFHSIATVKEWYKNRFRDGNHPPKEILELYCDDFFKGSLCDLEREPVEFSSLPRDLKIRII